MIDQDKRSKILDIGCGTGEILAYFLPRRGLGVDLSEKMIRSAREKYGQNKNLFFKVGDIEKQAIEGNFDYILLNDVIEHLMDIERAFENISRSMTSQTTLVVSMANPWWEPLLMILEKLHLKMPEGPHKRISEGEFEAILGKNKLGILEKRSYFSLIFVYKIKKVE